MALKPAHRLPRRLARPVKRETKRLVERRLGKQKRRFLERLRTVHRRSQRSFAAWRRTFVLWGGITFGVGVIVFIGFLIFSPVLTVQEMTVTRTDPRLDVEQVQAALVSFFGKRLPLVSERDVIDHVERAIADVASVEVRKQYPSHLFITVQLQPLFAALRIRSPDEEIPTSETGATVDYITNNGVYIQTARSVVTERTIDLVDWGVRPIPGTQLVTHDFLETMQLAEQQLEQQFGQTVSTRTLYVRAQEYHLRVDGRLDLWFDTRSPLEDHLLRYRTFLRTVPLEEVTQYIDLRLSDRVVYQ